MVMGDGRSANYDKGFYNIGVRRTTEDVSRGAPVSGDPVLKEFQNPKDDYKAFPLSYTALAHLAMHAEPQPGDHVLEQQADEFASAFLMPADDIAPYLPRGRVDWDELYELKRVWGVSLQALIVRAHRLGTIGDRVYQQAFRHMSRVGWRRNEPADLGPPEEPALVARAFGLLGQKGVSPEEVLRSVALPESLGQLAGPALAGRPSAPVVPLRPPPTSPVARSQTGS